MHLECNDNLPADKSFSNPDAEFRSHGRLAIQHSHAEKLKAEDKSKDAKSFEISSSLQGSVADAAESVHLKEIDYFHSFRSCDHQENQVSRNKTLLAILLMSCEPTAPSSLFPLPSALAVHWERREGASTADTLGNQEGKVTVRELTASPL